MNPRAFDPFFGFRANEKGSALAQRSSHHHRKATHKEERNSKSLKSRLQIILSRAASLPQEILRLHVLLEILRLHVLLLSRVQELSLHEA